MCRFIATTCDRFLSPMEVVKGLSAMYERYDGSTFGLLLRDLGGPFEAMKDAPILSGIFSSQGLKQLDHYMLRKGFTTQYKISFKLQPWPTVKTRPWAPAVTGDRRGLTIFRQGNALKTDSRKAAKNAGQA